MDHYDLQKVSEIGISKNIFNTLNFLPPFRKGSNIPTNRRALGKQQCTFRYHRGVPRFGFSLTHIFK